MTLARELADALAPLARSSAGAAELLVLANAAARALEGSAAGDAASLDAARTALEAVLNAALGWVKRRAQKCATQSAVWQALKASDTEAKFRRHCAQVREREAELGRALAAAAPADSSAAVSPEGVPAWAARFPEARRLRVRGSGGASEAAWAAAFSAVATRQPRLEELCLAADHDAGFGAATTLALATSALPRLVELRSLILTGNELGDAAAVAALAAALPRLAKLEKFEVRRTRLGAAGAAPLFAALAKLPALRELDVGGNDFGSAGAESLAAALPSLRRLEKLEVGASHIGAAGASALFAALPSLALLEELDVRHAGFGGAGASTLSSAVPRLPHLKVLRVKGNKFEDSAGKEHLVAAAAAAGPRLELEI